MAVPMRSLARADCFCFNAVREESSPAFPNTAKSDFGRGMIFLGYLYRS